MKKNYWLYGVLMGALLLVLQIVQFRTMIRDIPLELFGLSVAVIFMGLGIWLGVSIHLKRTRYLTMASSRARRLSKRELDVLVLMAEGHSNQEIADQLFVSLNTTKTHISNIFQKLGVKRRTQAVLKARRLGLLSSYESAIR